VTDDVEPRGLEPWQGDVFAAHIEDNRAHPTPWRGTRAGSSASGAALT
jgi:hypothetical protein